MPLRRHCHNHCQPVCHQTIDYDDPHWAKEWADQQGPGRMCAGALIFMANKMQHARTREFPKMPPDKVGVFANALEFVRHHREAARAQLGRQ